MKSYKSFIDTTEDAATNNDMLKRAERIGNREVNEYLYEEANYRNDETHYDKIKRTESCKNCALCLDLEVYDYSNGGCKHTFIKDDYICLAFKEYGEACLMHGISKDEMCEMCTPIDENNKTRRNRRKSERDEYANSEYFSIMKTIPWM